MRRLEASAEDELAPSYFNGFELPPSDLEFDDDEFDKQDISVSMENSIGLDEDKDSGDIEEELSMKLVTKRSNCNNVNVLNVIMLKIFFFSLIVTK